MVKEESDIIVRAGAMEREGEKVPGEARPKEHGPARPAPALGLCFPQGFIPGCSGASFLCSDIPSSEAQRN